MARDRSDERRPQTLKQAKAAYRKADKTSRLTEKERRQIRRQAELDDRAAKIREKEKRKLLNKKKREEKAKKEKQAALERAKAGADIDPQGRTKDGCERLDKFFTLKRKQAEGKADADGGQEEPEAIWLSEDSSDDSFTVRGPPEETALCVNEEDVATPNRQLGTASPVSPRPSNESAIQRPTESRKRAAENDEGDEDSDASRMPKRPRTENVPCTPITVAARDSPSKVSGNMSPPPRPMAKSTVLSPLSPNIARRTPRHSSVAVVQLSKSLIDDWEDVFASGTQIERELATPTPQPAHPGSRQGSVAIVQVSKSLLDDWEDAFASGTQLERELATPTRPLARTPIMRPTSPIQDDTLEVPPFSTQDLELTVEDLQEITGFGDVGLDAERPALRTRTATLTTPPRRGVAGLTATGDLGLGPVDESPVKSSYDSAGIDDVLLEAFQ